MFVEVLDKIHGARITKDWSSSEMRVRNISEIPVWCQLESITCEEEVLENVYSLAKFPIPPGQFSSQCLAVRLTERSSTDQTTRFYHMHQITANLRCWRNRPTRVSTGSLQVEEITLFCLVQPGFSLRYDLEFKMF